MPYDPEREHFAASYRAKQLVVLAADAVLASIRAAVPAPGRLVDEGLLPARYRDRYDVGFVAVFHHVTELTRNSLVGDLPHVASTVEQLAAHAIFREARRVIEEVDVADPALREQVEDNAMHLGDELDALLATAIEDCDALDLFAPESTDEHVVTAAQFEQWLVPHAHPPRPYIAYDGRAWPTDL